MKRYLAQRNAALAMSVWVAIVSPMPAQTIALLTDGGQKVAVTELGGKAIQARPLVTGTNPAISPDGKTIAFVESDADGNRFIATVDVATGKSGRVEGIPGLQNFGPIWSPDGSTLTFFHFAESDWVMAQVNAGGGGFRTFDKLRRQPGGMGWFPDGQRILCNDLDGFFVLRFEGDQVVEEDQPALKGQVAGLSMPSSLSVSPDGREALFDRIIDEDPAPGDDGPESSIF